MSCQEQVDQRTEPEEGVPPPILQSFDLAGVAEYIRAEHVDHIVVMTGAGLSTSAGIPDFRSPGTGLGMENPEDMFDLETFKENPKPFYVLARAMYPGRYCPTKAHAFIRMLADKGLLLRLYTQNIDTLDRVAGVPDDLVVEAHGSFHTARCTACREPADMVDVRRAVMAAEVARCAACGGVVKPDITFFGESLPARFFHCAQRDLPRADLLLVIGSSLSVFPFASLVGQVPQSCPRVLINREHAYDLEEEVPAHMLPLLRRRGDPLRYRVSCNFRDVGHLGDADEACETLASLLGWAEDLEGAHGAVLDRFREMQEDDDDAEPGDAGGSEEFGAVLAAAAHAARDAAGDAGDDDGDDGDDAGDSAGASSVPDT